MRRADIFREDTTGRNPRALEQGTLLRDQFRLGRVLGVGGFGVTYLAFDEVLEMVVAVKEYLPNNIAVRDTGAHTVRPLSKEEQEDFEFGLQRFLQEARMLAKFEEHPNIVRVRTFFEANGTGYLVMNYYEGRTLDEYLDIRNDFILESEALIVLEQVLDGLSAVHEKNILHRDIDPSNVYLADKGKVVLLDFGAARTAVGERTQDMSVVLKRGYAPYEQYHSKGDQGPWTDVYACSATLYRMLTGYKPPEATSRILEDELVPPKELVPSLSDATNEAVLEGLAVHPEDRLSTIKALSERLPKTSSEAVPGWEPESTGEEAPSAGPEEGTAELSIEVSHACRLYVDGARQAEASPGTTYSMQIGQGTHRLRAVRIDQESQQSETVTMSESGVDESAHEDIGLDAVLWKNVVTVSRGETTSVSINFGAESSSDSIQDSAPGPPPPEQKSLPERKSSRAPDPAPQSMPAEQAAAAPSPPGGDGESDASESGTLSFLEVRTDQPCDLFVDRIPEATLDAGGDQWVAVQPGHHRVRAVAIEGGHVWEHEIKSEPNQATTVSVILDRTPQERMNWNRIWSRLLHQVQTWLVDRPAQWGQYLFPNLSPRQVRIGLAGIVGLLLLGTTLLWTTVSGSEKRAARLETAAITAQPDRTVTVGETVVDVLANDQGPSGAFMSLQSARPLSADIQRVEVIDASRLRIWPAPTFTGTARVQYTVEAVGGATAESYVSVEVPFGGERAVLTRDAKGPQAVHAAPLTNDAGPDLVVASYDDNTVGWLDNRGNPPTGARSNSTAGRSGRFASFQPLTQSAEGALAVETADLSGNGHPDVLFAAERDGMVAWCENQGDGTFSSPQVITANATGVITVQAADLTGNDRPDVVVGARRNRRVTWYKNQGQGQLGSPQTLVEGINQLGAVHVADLNADAHPDILVASFQDDTITWYENQGRTAPLRFHRRRTLSSTVQDPIDLHTADLTGTGRPDVLASTAKDGAIMWFKNQRRGNGRTGFGASRPLAENVQVIEDIATTDLDGDGHQDIFAAGFDTNSLLWIEGKGKGEFGPPRVLDRGIVDPVSIDLVDIEGDGDVDVLSAAQGSDEVAWHENHLQ